MAFSKRIKGLLMGRGVKARMLKDVLLLCVTLTRSKVLVTYSQKVFSSIKRLKSLMLPPVSVSIFRTHMGATNGTEMRLDRVLQQAGSGDPGTVIQHLLCSDQSRLSGANAPSGWVKKRRLFWTSQRQRDPSLELGLPS